MSVKSPRVLVISESRITRRVAEATFADQQVELVLAASGAEGLEAWAAAPAAVVVIDLAVEAPDAIEIARHVGAGPTPAAVIALAGQGEAVNEDVVADAGVRALLRKPVDSRHLMDAVRGALRLPECLDGIAVESRATSAPLAPRPAPWPSAPPAGPDELGLEPPLPPGEALERWESAPVRGATPSPVPVATSLTDEDLERVADRVMALWTTSQGASAAVERVAPEATAAAADRLVRELAPRVVAEVAKLVVADVSERLVREEIARIRETYGAR